MATCTFSGGIDGDLDKAGNWDAKPTSGDDAVLAANATGGTIACNTLVCTGYSCVCTSASTFASTITVDATNAFTWGTGALCVAGVKAASGTAAFTLAADGALNSAAAINLTSVTVGNITGDCFSGAGSFAVSGSVICGNCSSDLTSADLSVGGDLTCGNLGGVLANACDLVVTGDIDCGTCGGFLIATGTLDCGGDVKFDFAYGACEASTVDIDGDLLPVDCYYVAYSSQLVVGGDILAFGAGLYSGFYDSAGTGVTVTGGIRLGHCSHSMIYVAKLMSCAYFAYDEANIPNLAAGNILTGKTILGVAGNVDIEADNPPIGNQGLAMGL